MHGDHPEDMPPSASGGRAEVDTSAPFQSVREAVDRFGGSAAWSSHLLKRMFKKHKQCEEGTQEAVNVGEQTAQLEQELDIKERETLDVLQQLESTKRIVAELKLKFQQEPADVAAAGSEEQRPENTDTDVHMEGSDEHLHQPPDSVLMELEQAKENLSRTKSDLAAIRASVELLCDSIAKEKTLLEQSREKLSSDALLVSSLEGELDRTAQELQTRKDLQRKREDSSDIFIEIKKMAAEIERLRNTAHASKSEALMLAAEIEQTKASVGTAEVRCLAAKKMEEAAKAAEAVALAEIKALLSTEASAQDHQVNLSVDNYFELASEAQEADENLGKNVEDAMLQVDVADHTKSNSLKRLEDAKLEVEKCKKALAEALKRVEAANQGKLVVEEAVRRWRFETGHKRHSFHVSPKFKNAAQRRKDSHTMDIVDDISESSLKPILSIGQILGMKLTGPDGYDKSIWDNGSETPNLSLGQILNRKRAILYSDGASTQKLSAKRKKFALTGLSVLLAKQAKSKKKRGAQKIASGI